MKEITFDVPFPLHAAYCAVRDYDQYKDAQVEMRKQVELEARKLRDNDGKIRELDELYERFRLQEQVNQKAIEDAVDRIANAIDPILRATGSYTYGMPGGPSWDVNLAIRAALRATFDPPKAPRT